MYKAKVNKKNFEIVASGNDLIIDGSLLQWDPEKLSEGYFHILMNAKSYRAEVVNADPAAKSFLVKINGEIYSVELKDKFDLLLEKMGMNNASAGRVNNIMAPMPGLIIDLRVKQGDQVMPGDPLLILECFLNILRH
jgi:acetyl/propionyl-CoA carboxylase alpha subunit